MKKSITPESYHDSTYSEYKAFDDQKYYIFKVYNIIKKLNKKYKFKKSLDVGCADGSFSKKLKDDFKFKVYGIDVSQNAINLAKKNGVNAIIHNLENRLPYPNNHFDLIISCEVIEHLYDTDFFLSELHRILKKEGILILTTPNLTSLINRMKILIGKYPNFVPEYKVGGAGHVRAYTIPVLRNQLKEHKFVTIIETSPNITFPIRSRIIPTFMKNIAIRLGDIFPKIGSHMIIVSRKR